MTKLQKQPFTIARNTFEFLRKAIHIIYMSQNLMFLREVSQMKLDPLEFINSHSKSYNRILLSIYVNNL